MPEAQSLNVYDLIKYYAKHWLLIATLTLCGLLIGFGYNSLIQKPSYKSNATLILISPAAATPTSDATTINNYLTLLKSRSVLQPVINELRLNTSYDALARSVSTSNDTNTEVMNLSITTNNPQTSKAVVNSTIVSFRKEVKDLYNADNVKVVDSASLPSTPTNIHKSSQLMMSAAAGFLLAVLIVFFMYDYRINNPAPQKKAVAKATVKVKKQRRQIKLRRPRLSIKARLPKRPVSTKVRSKKIRDSNGRFIPGHKQLAIVQVRDSNGRFTRKK